MDAEELKPRDGHLTRKIADELRLKYPGFEIYSDHAPRSDSIGRISAWIDSPTDLGRKTRLCMLDIAMVQDGFARVLIEIEESTDNPKTLLGDVFAAALAENFGFDSQPWKTSAATTLIVMGKGSHPRRLDFINRWIQEIMACPPAMNRHFGPVVIDSFSNETELRDTLVKHIKAAIDQ